MNDTFLDAVLDHARAAGVEAEAMLVESEETPVVFEANRLKSILSRQTTGAALRVIRNGRIGLASTNRLDNPAGLVEAALDTASYGAEAHFALPVQVAYSNVPIFDPAVPEQTTAQLVELGQSLIDRLRDGNEDVQCEARVSTSVTSFRLRNTSGADAGYRKSVFYHSVEGTRIRGTDMLYVGDGEVNTSVPKNPLSAAETGRQQLEWCRENVPAPTGRVPVLFTPDGVASVLAGALAIAFNGKTVLQGASPVGTRRGEMVFDPRLTLVDDGTLAHRAGSAPCDDEGVPTRRTVLVENGIVKSFYYDLQTAGRAAAASTGNGSRSLESLPNPSLHNLQFSEGSGTFEDLLRMLNDGIVVEQAIGAGQGNVLGGEFGGNVILGYRVQNGKIVGRVKDTMIAGNVYEALNDIIAIGGDGRWVGGGMFAPSILVGHIGVNAG